MAMAGFGGAVVAAAVIAGAYYYLFHWDSPAGGAGSAVSSLSPTGQAPGDANAQRVVRTVYDAWTVTCRAAEGGRRQMCSAVLPLDRVEGGRRQVLGAWLMARNASGDLVTILQVPIIQTQNVRGLLIEKGVELKLDDGSVHRVPYTTCGVNRCEAVLTMTDALIKQGRTASQAIITVHATNGTRINLNIGSLKGFDKAIAAIAR
jgi:invasion protein IalB